MECLGLAHVRRGRDRDRDLTLFRDVFLDGRGAPTGSLPLPPPGAAVHATTFVSRAVSLPRE